MASPLALLFWAWLIVSVALLIRRRRGAQSTASDEAVEPDDAGTSALTTADPLLPTRQDQTLPDDEAASELLLDDDLSAADLIDTATSTTAGGATPPAEPGRWEPSPPQQPIAGAGHPVGAPGTPPPFGDPAEPTTRPSVGSLAPAAAVPELFTRDQTPGSVAMDQAPLQAGVAQPVPDARPTGPAPAGGIGHLAGPQSRSTSVAEALAGIQMPADLIPLTMVDTHRLDANQIALVTEGHPAEEVGRGIADELERLGFVLTPVGDQELLAERAGDKLKVVIHPKPSLVSAGGGPAFPTAGIDSVVVELALR